MDIAAALDAQPDTRCKVQRLLDGIPADTPGKAALIAAIADGKRSHKSLEVAFARLGIRVAYETMRVHRLGVCGCDA